MDAKGKKKLVVVGHGMVAHRFVEKFVGLGGLEHFDLTVFGEELYPAYDRVHLSSYFEDNSHEKLLLATRDTYASMGVELRTSAQVTYIDRNLHNVQDKAGPPTPYDVLVLATGSSAFSPPLPGKEKAGVFVYRTIDDVIAIREYAKDCKAAAVIGGGLLGLEAAKASLDMGLATHVIEFAPRLMPRQLDADGAGLLKDKIEALGIRVHLGAEGKEVTGDGKVKGLALKDGSVLDVDMVIISAGIRPRDELARGCGIEVGERGGISVDDCMRTSDPQVFAIGEAALHRNFIYGLVAPGYEMASVAANTILGTEKSFTGFDMSTSLKLIGVDVASFGDAFGTEGGVKSVVYADKVTGIYKKLTISSDGSRLLGGILVGDASDYGKFHQFTVNGIVLPKETSALLFHGKASEGLGISSLPDSAEICKCNNVNKLAIMDAVSSGGVTDLAGLKHATKCGTGCGGCLPMAGELLKCALKDMGKTVVSHVCEHFPYTRQELVNIIRVKELKSFAEVLAAGGKGYGCEVCKPTVASILASTWNDLVAKHAVIQDTNDRFLANIQKGGSYSVIPRVPGGEITPQQLIAIGETAKKYNLYCKITGGQRIDLLGARVDQLPDIWEDLIEAGLESGHAYGKAMRTVKSCVGSTWCRYGVQDSTAFAIRIEERYKGIRAPHKLKSAVSGCIRECAEAQSKDFGLIATEKGWNIYVAGNGGARPRHADLLISDVDEETAIRYLDRFIMYYIKTADRLTRTSVWLEGLEGGIGRLREIIVDDALGIGAELEGEMQALAGTYKCEWTEVVKNPELRAQFRHFVNTNQPDDRMGFVGERGQKRPKEPAAV